MQGVKCGKERNWQPYNVVAKWGVSLTKHSPARAPISTLFSLNRNLGTDTGNVHRCARLRLPSNADKDLFSLCIKSFHLPEGVFNEPRNVGKSEEMENVLDFHSCGFASQRRTAFGCAVNHWLENGWRKPEVFPFCHDGTITALTVECHAKRKKLTDVIQLMTSKRQELENILPDAQIGINLVYGE